MTRRTRLTAILALGFISVLAGCSVTTARTSAAVAPGREVIAPAGASTLAPYSPAIRTGDLLFLSGQIGLRPGTRDLVAGGVGPETRQTIENVRTVLEAAGLSLGDLVKCTVFLADIAEYAAMNAVYGSFFTSAPPARSAVGVGGLPLGARVEIECIARTRP